MITCRSHVHLWHTYKDEVWAQEFKIAQRRQSYISEMELGENSNTNRVHSKPETRSLLKDKIIALYKEGLTRSAICKKLSLSKSTVVNAIWKYNKGIVKTVI